MPVIKRKRNAPEADLSRLKKSAMMLRIASKNAGLLSCSVNGASYSSMRRTMGPQGGELKNPEK